VTGQDGGRRQCGGIVYWRQRRTGANSRCCIHCYLRNAVLGFALRCKLWLIQAT